MLPAKAAISRMRRDLTLAAALRWALLCAFGGWILFGKWMPGALGSAVPLFVLGGVWVMLSFQSMKGSRLAAQSPSLIAAGQFDAAELQIDQALRTFSLYRGGKLLSLHHLALLRHAQRRWQESAALCDALLRQKLGSLGALVKTSRLMLADSLLEMGDLRGAALAINALFDQRLSLGEAMRLLQVQSEYQARVGAWDALFSQITTKVQLAELMASEPAARVQALLALAAKNVGRSDWESWLRRRVELLADVQELTVRRPLLKELWTEAGGEGVATPHESDRN